MLMSERAWRVLSLLQPWRWSRGLGCRGKQFDAYCVERGSARLASGVHPSTAVGESGRPKPGRVLVGSSFHRAGEHAGLPARVAGHSQGERHPTHRLWRSPQQPATQRQALDTRGGASGAAGVVVKHLLAGDYRVFYGEECIAWASGSRPKPSTTSNRNNDKNNDEEVTLSPSS